jgi:hypothetical protein
MRTDGASIYFTLYICTVRALLPETTVETNLTSAANGHLGTSRITGPTPPTLTAIDPYNIQSLGRKPWHLIVLLLSSEEWTSEFAHVLLKTGYSLYL